MTCSQVLQGLSCDVYLKSSVCVSVRASACGTDVDASALGSTPGLTGAPSPPASAGIKGRRKTEQRSNKPSATLQRVRGSSKIDDISRGYLACFI